MPGTYKIITEHKNFPVDATFENVDMTYTEGVLQLKRGNKIVLLKSKDMFIMEMAEAKEVTQITNVEGEEKPKVESTQAPVTPGQPGRPIVNPSQPNKAATATPVKS